MPLTRKLREYLLGKNSRFVTFRVRIFAKSHRVDPAQVYASLRVLEKNGHIKVGRDEITGRKSYSVIEVVPKPSTKN